MRLAAEKCCVEHKKDRTHNYYQKEPMINPDPDVEIDPEKMDWLSVEDIEEGEGE